MAQPTGVYFQYRADDAVADYATATTAGGVVNTAGTARPNAAPTSAATRPTLTAGGASGHSYLSFDGVDDRLTTSNGTDPSMLAFGNAKTGLTLSAVVKVDPAALAGALHQILFFSVGASTGTRVTISADATGNWGMGSRRLDSDATVSLATTTPIDNGLHHLLGVIDYSTATQRLYLDGVLIGSQAAGTTGTTSATNGLAWSWGSSATPTAWAKADYYEVAGYDRALTTTEVADYWAFEKARYAIAGATPVTATGTATFTGSGSLTASGSTVPPAVTRLRVLRAGVESGGTAKLRVLRAAVATDTGIAANAGAPVTADSRDIVFISAAASGGAPVGWTWTQTTGPAVSLQPSNTVAEPFFVAPATDTGTTLGFSLTVRNSNGTTSTNPASVSVTVRPHIEWAYLGGAWLPVSTDAMAKPAPPNVTRSAADAAILEDNPSAFFPLGVGAGVTQDAAGGPLAAVAFGFPGTTTMPNGDKAAVLDGIADYFEVGDDPSLSAATTGQLTVEMWLRPDVLNFPVEEARTADPYVHFAGKGTTGQHEYALRLYSANREGGTPAAAAGRFAGFVFNLAGGTAPGASWQGGVKSTDDGTPPTLVVGQWVHYALVVDDVNQDATGVGTIAVYRNGVLMSRVAMTGVTIGRGSAPLRIGTRDLASYFQGAIGKVAVYQTALEPARLLAHFQAMTGTGISGPSV